MGTSIDDDEPRRAPRPAIPPHSTRDRLGAAIAPGIGSLNNGDVVGERFLVGDVIGEGGTSVVHGGVDLVTREAVAIKVPRTDLAGFGGIAGRFALERYVGGLIRSRHVARRLGAGRLADGRSFIAMEYVGGPTLAARIAAGPLSIVEACDVAQQVLVALREIHDLGVIHRDIKPHNVLLTPSRDGRWPRIKLIDFGACKRTPLYMAPEQILGGETDVRTDVYGVGALLFEAITGVPPFPGEAADAVVARVLQGLPPRPTRLRPGCPKAVERVVLKALALKPADRFADVDEMRAALRAAVHGHWHSRRRWTSALGIAAALALAVLPANAALPGLSVGIEGVLRDAAELARTAGARVRGLTATQARRPGSAS
jgi:serine/threonine-protein kinase